MVCSPLPVSLFFFSLCVSLIFSNILFGSLCFWHAHSTHRERWLPGYTLLQFSRTSYFCEKENLYFFRKKKKEIAFFRNNREQFIVITLLFRGMCQSNTFFFLISVSGQSYFHFCTARLCFCSFILETSFFLYKDGFLYNFFWEGLADHTWMNFSLL